MKTALTLFLILASPPPELTGHLETLRAVGPEGRGNREASRAWQEVVKAGSSELPRILAAMDGAGPLGANWIRAAVDTLAEGELARGGKLPAKELEDFILRTDHDPRARRLAYEWLRRIDPTAPDRLIPKMENDPSPELRREAVDRLLKQAEGLFEKKDADASGAFRKALAHARDEDQIKTISGRLRELGQPVDLSRHFGFLNEWRLIGPFDHTGSKAFDVPYPPEREILLDAEYDGKDGKVLWREFATRDDYGVVDLNGALGRHKGAIAYALAEFESVGVQDVELRLGTVNAWKVWVNGNLLFGHEEYHHGMALDQFQVPAKLQPGRNRILLKICQNEQTEDYAQHWRFQIRVCDATGTAVLSKTRKP